MSRAPLTSAQCQKGIDSSVRLAKFYEERATRLDPVGRRFALEDAAEQRRYEKHWKNELLKAQKRERIAI